MYLSSTKYVKKKHAQVVPGGMNEWPVVALSRNREDFIKKVAEESIRRIKALAPTPEGLIEEIETTVFREKLRIKRNRWAVDPEDEASFFNSIKARLLDISQINSEKEKAEALNEILEEVTLRYAHEIAGNFKKSRYHMARSVVTFGFARLLNASRARGFW